MALTLFIVSQQSLALFYIEERRSATRANYIYTPGHNDLLLYSYMENIDGFLSARYTPENIEEVGNVPRTRRSPGWATG